MADVPLRPKKTARSVCGVDGCAQFVKAHGWCPKHLYRWRQFGDPRKGGKQNGSVTVQGYRSITVCGARVMEHRHVMEQHIGRRLFADEFVHHVNGVKTDNRLDNLELWTSRHPKGQRVDELMEWAIDLLRRYRPELLLDTEAYGKDYERHDGRTRQSATAISEGADSR